MTSYNIFGKASTLEQVFLTRVTSHPVLYDLSEKYESVKDNPSQVGLLNNDSPTGPLQDGEAPDMTTLRPRNSCLSCFQVFVASIVIITVICFTLVFCRQYIKSILFWMENLDMYISCAIYLLLFLVVSFPLVWGYLLLIVSAGYLYGFPFGACMVMLCASCGVLLSHVTLKRTCNKRILDKFHNDKIAAIVRVVESDQGLKVVTLARLTPIPFGLQNAIFAMTNIQRVKYCLASSLGIVPMVLLNCYLGSTLRSMKDVFSDGEENSTAYFIFSIQVVLTICFMAFVVRKARQELALAVDSAGCSATRKTTSVLSTHASYQNI